MDNKLASTDTTDIRSIYYQAENLIQFITIVKPEVSLPETPTSSNDYALNSCVHFCKNVLPILLNHALNMEKALKAEKTV